METQLKVYMETELKVYMETELKYTAGLTGIKPILP